MNDLDVAMLRQRLKRTLPASAVYGDDGVGREPPATVAAVLVPIIAHPGALTVLFTQRTAHLKAHSGQVSFPGGRAEPEDGSPEDTALRECEEEIGLPRSRVELLGRLPEYFTRTGFRVTPVIGLIEPPLALSPHPGEVESVFEVPLAFLLDTRNHQRHTREFQGATVGYYAMPYKTDEGERHIWGATAGMLVNLCRALAE